jgi:DNA repair protein RecO (recombination protein O)
MVGFFTEQRGMISAVARSARRSARRFPAIEPMHLLRVTLDVRPDAEVAVLAEAAIERPRLRLVADLGRLEVAGRALRWVREIAPVQTAERRVWQELNGLLDRLDASDDVAAEALLVESGLRLLVAFGWGLELTQCVRCGRPCRLGATAYADAAAGGLVCRACGGGRILLRPDLRARLLAAMGDAPGSSILSEDVPTAFDLVEGALAAHAS